MKTRRLGKSDLVVSAVGLGCMSMTPFYGVPDEVESVATLRRAVDVGVTLFDTALYYGDGPVPAGMIRATLSQCKHRGFGVGAVQRAKKILKERQRAMNKA